MRRLGAQARPDESVTEEPAVIDIGDIDVFLGPDVGKGGHQATAVTSAGKETFDKHLPNTGTSSTSCLRNSGPNTGPRWSWPISRTRSGPCRRRSPGTSAARSPAYWPAWTISA